MADPSFFLSQFGISNDDSIPEYSDDIFDSTFDTLQSIRNLKENIEIDNVYGRQLAAKNIVHTMQNIIQNDAERDEIWEVLPILARDSESSIRIEFIEKVPQLVSVSLESNVFEKQLIKQNILTIIANSLSDANAQVRRAAHDSLMALIHSEFILEVDVTGYVWEIIEDLANSDSPDDFRSESVVLMAKIGPLMSCKLLQDTILPKFLSLCSDSLFIVRKVCAINLGSLCGPVGIVCAETQLLPSYLSLCRDGVWGVRKACAESCAEVAAGVSMERRWTDLTNVVIGLLQDTSRWVRMAAFQQLGHFIATFADSNKSGLILDANGCVKHVGLSAKIPPVHNVTNTAASVETRPQSCTSVDSVGISNDEVFFRQSCIAATPDSVQGVLSSDGRSRSSSASYSLTQCDKNTDVISDKKRVCIHLDNSEDISSFTYWRFPLPDIDVNLEFEQGVPRSIVVSTRVTDPSMKKVYTTEMCVGLDQQQPIHSDCNVTPIRVRTSSTSMVLDSDSDCDSHTNSGCVTVSPRDRDSLLNILSKQDILPESLLSAYLSMVDLDKQQSVDAEICRHCAYSFPAVAFTLGPRNWKCLRNLFDILAQDMQWKVRRALAFSLHELAAILGSKLTATDLRRAYSELASDLDEVRVGLVQHLSQFLNAVPPHVWEEMVLRRLPALLRQENRHNWRYRMDFAKQLLKLVDLLQCGLIHKYVVPCMWDLFRDQVFEVRRITYFVVCAVLHKYSEVEALNSETDYLFPLLRSHVAKQAENSQWEDRQQFAQLCGVIAGGDYFDLDGSITTRISVLPESIIAEELLPALLILVADPVVSVRISLARTLNQVFLRNTYFSSPSYNPHYAALLGAVNALRADKDRDVRLLAGAIDVLKSYVVYDDSTETIAY